VLWAALLSGGLEGWDSLLFSQVFIAD
jgi:hypothetical protein